MYRWRKMTKQEQAITLQSRKQGNQPWHCPPHTDTNAKKWYIISAACYEHKNIMEQDGRMFEIEHELINLCNRLESNLGVWCVLPNHYHILVETDVISGLLRELGKMHGRTSRKWNLQDASVGRKVWFNCTERTIKSDRHYWASVNYIHHNPIKHGYAEKWTDWQFSSADKYLNDVGKDKAMEIWKKYPILDYGKKWDNPDGV